jgi:hypothetical protein
LIVPRKTEFSGLVRLLYQTQFPLAQGIWVEGFLELMLELRRVFGNDLDKVIILSTIGQQLLRDGRLPKRSYGDWIGTPPIDLPHRATNIDALARATRIPRESVRRKVNELIADGLVRRDEENRLVIAAGAAARLANSTHVTIEMLDNLIAAYLAILTDLRAIETTRLPHPR